LDYAAATHMDSAVLEAMQPYFTANFYNPSATYLAGRSARQALEAARHQVAQLIGARASEVVFTAGATEANNLAIQGLMRNYPEGDILISAIEHESVLAPTREFKHQEIPVSQQGIVDLAKLEKMIGDKTVLVSVMLVNNELGTIQPLREIAEILNKLSISRQNKGNKFPLYLHTDAAQAPNYLDIHVSRLGVDFMSLNGSKIYGPKQSGTLYVKAAARLRPLISGGGQEFGLRSGTENMAGIAGFAKALEIADTRRRDEVNKIAKLRQSFEELLQKTGLQIVINGANNRRAPHISSVSFAGVDNERLMMELDERGIQCAVGSACSASRKEASHVLSAIGLGEAATHSTLRFSFGRQTTNDDIQKAVHELVQLTDQK
jgi:cysteine desulfurase